MWAPERSVELGANPLDDGDDRDGEAGGDQTIFDGSDADAMAVEHAEGARWLDDRVGDGKKNLLSGASRSLQSGHGVSLSCDERYPYIIYPSKIFVKWSKPYAK